MATAYRRKRIMEGIISGDKEVQAQIAQLSEKQTQEALNQLRNVGVEKPTKAEVSNRPPPLSRRSLAKVAHLQLDEELLSMLSLEERRLLGAVAQRQHDEERMQRRSGRASKAPGELPPLRTSAAGTALAKPHFAHTARHNQLLEMPQVFDLKFSKPTIKLPPGTRTVSTLTNAIAKESMTKAGSSRDPGDIRGVNAPAPRAVGAYAKKLYERKPPSYVV